VSFSGVCFSGLYHAFKAETWVDLRSCAHGDLCKLNVIYLRRLSMFWKLLYHVFSALFDCRKVWPNTKIFLCLWYVRKAWQKQACIKIKDVVL
jgi:hypothetical protein